MIAVGVLVGIFGVVSVLAGVLGVFMPIFHIKQAKRCKFLRSKMKSGIFIHIQHFSLLSAVTLYCGLVYSLENNMDVDEVSTDEGATLLFIAYGIMLITYFFYHFKYKVLIQSDKIKTFSEQAISSTNNEKAKQNQIQNKKEDSDDNHSHLSSSQFENEGLHEKDYNNEGLNDSNFELEEQKLSSKQLDLSKAFEKKNQTKSQGQSEELNYNGTIDDFQKTSTYSKKMIVDTTKSYNISTLQIIQNSNSNSNQLTESQQIQNSNEIQHQDFSSTSLDQHSKEEIYKSNNEVK